MKYFRIGHAFFIKRSRGVENRFYYYFVIIYLNLKYLNQSIWQLHCMGFPPRRKFGCAANWELTLREFISISLILLTDKSTFLRFGFSKKV